MTNENTGRQHHEYLKSRINLRNRLPWLVLVLLAGLIAFQAYAYFYKLTLSLGPRVILQPWAMQNGAVIYENLVDVHTPLMPLAITEMRYLIPGGLRLAKLLVVGLLSLSTLVTFSAGLRKIGWWGGLWAAGFFVIWSPAPIYILLFLLYEATAIRKSSRAALLSGFLGGVAILIKQHAVVLLLVYILWLTYTLMRYQFSRRDVWRQIGWIVLGGSLPLITIIVYQYSRASTLNGFLYWTIGYTLNSQYSSQGALLPTYDNLKVYASAWLLVPVAILTWWNARHNLDKTWFELGLALLMLFTSIITIYPRFAVFHLQASLPLLALVSLLTLANAIQPESTQRIFAIGVTLALSAYWLLTAGMAYRSTFSPQPNRFIYEYSNLVPLARTVKQQIGTGTCFYIFPDDEATSNLYYLCGCMPPKFWIFHYPWYMLDWVKERILSDLAKSPPEWIIYFPGRWETANNVRLVYDYLQSHYQKQATLPWAQGDVWLMKKIK
jgi:hypothetical protein